ncbi:SIS domain-containing protein [Chloroflexota bacterium]
MGLRDEILQQPVIAQNLIDQGWEEIQEIARKIREQEIKYIFLTARGTSDNAGLYAKYLLGINNGIPIALAAPSIISVYKRSVKLDQSLVLGISQSGQSPDIVSVLESGKQQGAMTLAITNAPSSPLAKAADHVIDIRAGEEKAVAATKTYSAQLMSIALLSIALAEDENGLEELRSVHEYMWQVLSLETKIKQAVERYYYMQHCVVLGRGYNYATSFEWALKLKELTYVIAEPYSSADFLHGPIAIVDRGFPVMVVMPKGAIYFELAEVVLRLHNQNHASLLILSNEPKAEQLADVYLPLPENLPEWISPIVSILPAQLFCYHLTRMRGIDTESPRGLTKVTETK